MGYDLLFFVLCFSVGFCERSSDSRDSAHSVVFLFLVGGGILYLCGL